MREGWEIKPMGDVGTFQRGGGFLKSDFVENGFPCIHYGQIHMKLGPTTYSHLTSIPKSVAAKSKIASSGDVIIAITSEDVEGSCKSTAWMGGYDVAIGAHAAIYKHNLNPQFVSYYIQSCYFQKEKEQYTHGFKVVEIKPSDIAKIPIRFPSLPEQQRIVDILDREFAKIDALKANAEKSLQAAKDLFQATLKKELEPKEGWTILPLSGIVDEGSHISYGIVQPGDDFPGGVPVVRPVDLTSPVLRSTSTFKRTRPEISQAYRRSILTGKEILLCVRGTTGVLSLSSGALKGCNTTRGIVPLCVADDTKRQFVYYALLSPACQKFIVEYTNGTALKQINIADVKNIPVPVAPKKEQEKVVSILDELTRSSKKLQENYQKTLTLCDDLKQSLLRKAFNGEL